MLNLTLVVTSIYFTDSTNGWATGIGGTGNILHTTNGGTDWSFQTTPVSSTLSSIYFTDSTNGWAAGVDGTILHTTNGGTSWSSQTTPGLSNMTSIYFTDSMNGWAAGWWYHTTHYKWRH